MEPKRFHFCISIIRVIAKYAPKHSKTGLELTYKIKVINYMP